MMKVNYKVEFLDYWHISLGVSGGARVDSVVVKDNNNLPYIPGKTIKGLAREMSELLDEKETQEIFGEEESSENYIYFSNLTLPKTQADKIVKNSLQEYLYSEVASTKINENGVAVDKSLREIEVVVPLVLEGFVEVKADIKRVEQLKNSLLMIKRMGLNRNRGLGRCQVQIVSVEEVSCA